MAKEPLNMRYVALDQGDLDMLEIEIQQTPTDELLAERAALRKKIQGGYVGVREPGSGYHPDLATLQIIERELNRRGGYWPNDEADRVIQRSDVPLDGPQTFDLIKRDVPTPVTVAYAQKKPLTEDEITAFVRELAQVSNAELQEMYDHFTTMVDDMIGFVRQEVGLHPDLEKLELVEQEKLDREFSEWRNNTLLRGALVGSIGGTIIGYVSERSIGKAALVGGVASAVAARYSWWWRKIIGAAAPPDEVVLPEDKPKPKAELGAYWEDPNDPVYRLGAEGDLRWVAEPRLRPDLYWRR